MVVAQASIALDFQGHGYVLCGRRDAEGFPEFWLERSEAPGAVWSYVSERMGGTPPKISRFLEIVPATEDGPTEFIEELALLSGWFVKTGRSIEHPRNRRADVWRLTGACPLTNVVQGVSYPDMQPTPEPTLSVAEARWVEKLTALNVAASVLSAPDPFLDDGHSRLVLAAFPEPLADFLRASDPTALEVAGRTPGSAAEWGELNTAPYPASAALAEFGYASWISLRLPLTPSGHLEVLLLGNEELLHDPRAATAALSSMNLLSDLKRAAASNVIRITPRERECLVCAYRGLTAEETACLLKCTARTVSFHLGNLMSKLRARSTAQAIYKAQTLGII